MALLKGLPQRPDRSILTAMPQSLARILVHAVFSTKDRRPLLRDTVLRQELHHYLGGILKHLDCQPIIGRLPLYAEVGRGQSETEPEVETGAVCVVGSLRGEGRIKNAGCRMAGGSGRLRDH